jgi:hypothetical protein
MRAFVRALLLCGLSSLLLHAADEARLLNIATRTQVGGAAGTPALGFVVRGAATPRILVRAVGPGLAPFGITQWLADPQLTLISGGAKVASNDNWQAVDGATMTAVGAFSLPSGSKDSAIVASLPAADYSAPLASGDGKTGVGLLEVYDASGLGTGSLINASTLSFVGTGDALLIPGFVIGGQGNLRMLIRAVGPGLATFGVPNLLADPTLTLYRDGVPLTSNDDWSTVGSSADVAAAAKAAGAFDLKAGSKDAALLVSLAGGRLHRSRVRRRRHDGHGVGRTLCGRGRRLHAAAAFRGDHHAYVRGGHRQRHPRRAGHVRGAVGGRHRSFR